MEMLKKEKLSNRRLALGRAIPFLYILNDSMVKNKKLTHEMILTIFSHNHQRVVGANKLYYPADPKEFVDRDTDEHASNSWEATKIRKERMRKEAIEEGRISPRQKSYTVYEYQVKTFMEFFSASIQMIFDLRHKILCCENCKHVFVAHRSDADYCSFASPLIPTMTCKGYMSYQNSLKKIKRKCSNLTQSYRKFQ